MYKFPLFLLMFIFLFLSFIPIVHAEDVNFLELPERVGELFFNGNTFAGGLVCSLIVWMVFLLPSLYLIRNQDTMIALSVILLFTTMILAICVAITWLPVWVLIFIVFTDMIFLASKINTWIGGS